MSRVFTSPSTGAGVYVFSDDHCPPHIHARHRGEGWIARVQFSFVGNVVELLQNSPPQRTVNQLLGDIESELPACRRIWWTTQKTTCLGNQWAIMQAGKMQISSAAVEESKKIAEANYDPEQELLRVKFHDGTTLNASTLS
jgi:hypothetical protein